jgi:hypothetical protein
MPFFFVSRPSSSPGMAVVMAMAMASMIVVVLFAAHSSAAPGPPPQTSFPVERFVIDLDLPPQQRCTSPPSSSSWLLLRSL